MSFFCTEKIFAFRLVVLWQYSNVYFCMIIVLENIKLSHFQKNEISGVGNFMIVASFHSVDKYECFRRDVSIWADVMIGTRGEGFSGKFVISLQPGALPEDNRLMVFYTFFGEMNIYDLINRWPLIQHTI